MKGIIPHLWELSRVYSYKCGKKVLNTRERLNHFKKTLSIKTDTQLFEILIENGNEKLTKSALNKWIERDSIPPYWELILDKLCNIEDSNDEDTKARQQYDDNFQEIISIYTQLKPIYKEKMLVACKQILIEQKLCDPLLPYQIAQ